MHLGFTIVALALLSGFIIFAGGAALALAAFLIERRRGLVRRPRVTAAALLPIPLVAYLWLGFISYLVLCDVRGVDAGVFDDHKEVPLDGGYSLVVNPPHEQQFLSKLAGGPVHHRLSRIALTSRFLAGEDGEGYFAIDLQRGHTLRVQSAEELKRTLAAEGVTNIELLSPDQLYNEKRRSVVDWLAATLVFGPPMAALGVLGRKFLRS